MVASAYVKKDLEDFTGFEGGASTAYSSPGAPSIFDVSLGPNAPGTVSPQDLLVQEPFMSAPNSTAFTALTSPSPYQSPDFDVYDVSPNFGTTDFESGPNTWFSLFPDQVAMPEQTTHLIPESPAQPTEDVEDVSPPAPARRKSGGSPGAGRHASVAGVNSRRRDKPLPPIVVEDPSDTVAMKRARNTLAARKSRERKAMRFDELEERIRKLEAERDHWKNIALGRSG